jgi:phage protein D
MGYKDDTTVMVQGKITRLSPTFPAGGQPTLAISGVGPRHDLRGKQESHVYEDMTDTEVAKKIAGRLGVQLSTDPESSSKEERFAYLVQDNQFDIVFLKERARRIGYEVYIDPASEGKKIYFGPSTKRNRPEFELVYGKSLIQFSPNLDASNQVYKVKVIGSDPIKKEPIEKTVTRSDISVTGLGCPSLRKKLEKAFKKKEEVVSDASVNSVQEATTLARELLQKNAKQMVTASGSTVGVPELRAGTVLRIGGLDECFNGRYFVTGTTHSIGGKGYTTKFDCRLEEI